YGTCARATWARADPTRRSELAALGQLIRLSWGSDEPGFRQIYDARFLPDGPLELWRAFDQLQRRSTSPENAYQLWRAFGRLDGSCDDRITPHDRRPVQDDDAVLVGDRRREAGHGLVLADRRHLHAGGDHVPRADGGQEPPGDREEHAARAGQLLGHDGVEQ